MEDKPDTEIHFPDESQIQSAVLSLYADEQYPALLFHHYTLSDQVAKIARDLARQEGLAAEEVRLLAAAAWFYFSGYLVSAPGFARHSAAFAGKFLASCRVPAEYIARIESIIMAAGAAHRPTELTAQILSDAAHAASYSGNFRDRQGLLRTEAEQLHIFEGDTSDWQQYLLGNLQAVRFYTHSGRLLYEPPIALEIARLKRRVKDPEPVETTEPYSCLEGNALRAAQTFFRSNYHTHINLSAIADNKANIMISVNSILISVLISMLTYRNMADTNPRLLLPVVIFLVTGLSSLIFAVLSARPKVTMLNRQPVDLQQAKKNLVFFGNFVTLSPEEYEAAMNEVLRDDALLYGNMVRDMYYLGKVLEKKYRFLTLSYNLFMLGFVATVSTFLWAILND